MLGGGCLAQFNSCINPLNDTICCSYMFQLNVFLHFLHLDYSDYYSPNLAVPIFFTFVLPLFIIKSIFLFSSLKLFNICCICSTFWTNKTIESANFQSFIIILSGSAPLSSHYILPKICSRTAMKYLDVFVSPCLSSRLIYTCLLLS